MKCEARYGLPPRTGGRWRWLAAVAVLGCAGRGGRRGPGSAERGSLVASGFPHRARSCGRECGPPDGAGEPGQADDLVRRVFRDRSGRSRSRGRRDGEPQGVEDGGLPDVHRGGIQSIGRGSSQGDHRAVGQRRERRPRGACERHGRGFRPVDERPCRASGHDGNQLRELARASPRTQLLDCPRHRHSHARVHQGLPRRVSLARAQVVHLR